MRTRRILVIAGGALALLAAGTAAGAAVVSPVDASGVIHGCYTTNAVGGSHVFVLQNAGTSCPKGTAAISWNQAGSGTQGWFALAVNVNDNITALALSAK